MIFAKEICKSFIAIVFLSLYATIKAQSVGELISGYSGNMKWNDLTKTVTFLTSGDVVFPEKGVKSFIWVIPTSVTNVVIKKDVRVNAVFHSHADVCIEGEDRKTSVVYGTELQSWPQKHRVVEYTICTFQNFGGTMTIKNLTSLNPRGFHVRGWGTTMMVSYCDFLDTRGGHGNHSDGVEGGDGSVFDNCYFETGDDIFKVYFDILVTNCTIKMVQNTVPIQLGWGSYSDRKTGTFRNLKRGAVDNAIINGRRGKYNVTVNIDGCDIDNPNAVWVALNETTTGLKCNVPNAKINVKSHTGQFMNGKYELNICGFDTQLNQYNCINK